MAKTVVGMFDRFLLAEDAVDQLEKAGFPKNDISIVAGQEGAHARKSEDDSAGMVAGAGAGAAIGGVAGLVLGLGALAIPGIGPLVAAGPIAAALGSAGIGAAAGGFLGALTGMNIPEDDAGYYAEAVRQGGAMVIVKADEAHANVARDILNRAGARDIRDRDGQGGDPLSHSSEPAAPQIALSGARIYEDGLEMNPRKSRFEDFEPDYRAHFEGRFQGSGYTPMSKSPPPTAMAMSYAGMKPCTVRTGARSKRKPNAIGSSEIRIAGSR
jgi:hypothetical protein